MCSHVKGIIEDREELKNQLRNIISVIDMDQDDLDIMVNRIVLLISTMLRQERLRKDDRTL